MSSSNQRPANRGFRSVLRCAISHYRQFPWLSAPEPYDDYALREKVRGDVGQRKDRDDVFSASAARYWSAIDDLCRAIDQGDASIGLPPYNGGLFDRQRVPLLTNIRLGDEVMAEAIDALSFEQTPMAAATSTIAISAFSNSVRSTSACSNTRSSAMTARLLFVPTSSRGRDRAATTRPTIWSA